MRAEAGRFHKMFDAAQIFKFKGDALLSNALAHAHFVTDSLTMTLLFKLAAATCRAAKDNPVEPMPPLVVLSQHVHGKIFMKALPAADGTGMVKRDAAGRIVPPRYRFCERMERIRAHSFQRTTEYQFWFPSEFSPEPQEPGSMESFLNIVIHDADLTEPTSATCSVQSCNGHGFVDMHAVPFVAAVRDGGVSEFDVWDQYKMSDLIPRAFFAGCSNVLIYRHSLHGTTASGLPRFFFTISANEVSDQDMADWEQSNRRELCCLVSILSVIRAQVRACGTRHRRTGGQVVTRLQPSLKASETENRKSDMGADSTTDYELFSEEVAAETRLVSADDATVVRRFMVEEGLLGAGQSAANKKVKEDASNETE